MGMFSSTPAEKAVRDAKRIAQQQANQGKTKAQSERGSAAWHRLDDAQKAMKKGRR
jgi:hypothetical protein